MSLCSSSGTSSDTFANPVPPWRRRERPCLDKRVSSLADFFVTLSHSSRYGTSVFFSTASSPQGRLTSNNAKATCWFEWDFRSQYQESLGDSKELKCQHQPGSRRLFLQRATLQQIFPSRNQPQFRWLHSPCFLENTDYIFRISFKRSFDIFPFFFATVAYEQTVWVGEYWGSD